MSIVNSLINFVLNILVLGCIIKIVVSMLKLTLHPKETNIAMIDAWLKKTRYLIAVTLSSWFIIWITDYALLGSNNMNAIVTYSRGSWPITLVSMLLLYFSMLQWKKRLENNL